MKRASGVRHLAERHLGWDVPSLMLRAVDLGLLAVMMIAPFFMGGRHPVGELVYLVVVCFTAIVWSGRQCLLADSSYIRTGIEFWLACCFCLIVAQLIPLPASLLSQVSPGTNELLPLWSAETEAGVEGLGTWSTISLLPQATRGSLALFIAHAMLFVVVVQRIRSLSDIEWFLRCLSIAAIAMAIVGLAQFFVGNGKFLGIYQHPFRDTSSAVKGTFINENHFAHFLALGLGPLLWWLAQFHQRDAKNGGRPVGRGSRSASPFGRSSDASHWQRHGGLILSFALGIVVFAGLLTYSRGGVLILLLSLLVCAGLLAWKTRISKTTVVSFAAVGSVVLTATLIYGFTPLSGQLASLSEGSLEALDGKSSRRHLWQANLQAFQRFPAFGSGGGSHVEVYKTFFDEYSPVEYTHAESGYVQILSEYGLAGTTLLVFAIAAIAVWCARIVWLADSTRLLACSAAVIAGLTASLVHSIWDFVWYLPSCMSIVIILAACACRLSYVAVAKSSSRDNPNRGPRWFTASRPIVASRAVWITATLVICATSALIVRHQVGPAVASTHWERFLATAKMIKENPNETQRDSASRTLVKHLENAVGANPNDARANLNLAANYIHQFDVLQQTALNPMPLSVIRDAVLSSNFPTTESRDNWLLSAVGENCRLLKKSRYYAQRSLQLCPLQGEGYLLLNELAFLGDSTAAQRQSLIGQAMRVRPHDGAVLIVVGANAARAGDIEQALASWKQVFRVDPEQQARLIEFLAPQVDASFFLAQFQPDLSGLKLLYAQYREMGRDDQAVVVGLPFGESLVAEARTKTGTEAVMFWRQGYTLYGELGDRDRCLFCARQSVLAAPEDFAARRVLAFELMRQNQFDQAIEQIQWCLYRKPNDRPLNSALKKSYARRLERATASLTKSDETIMERR